ncbi:MAG TPA: biotin/lipoyl-binding protein, partial [Anaerolineae bacterium]
MKAIQLRVVIIVSTIMLMTIGCQVLPGVTSGGASDSVWTGFIEGETLDISSQAGGTITDLAVTEGVAVQAGQLLYALQDDLVRGRIEIADANVAAAQAQVTLLEQGARPEDIRQAEARVEQARASLAAATRAFSDTLAIRELPQTLRLVKAQANMRVEAASAQ